MNAASAFRRGLNAGRGCGGCELWAGFFLKKGSVVGPTLARLRSIRLGANRRRRGARGGMRRARSRCCARGVGVAG